MIELLTYILLTIAFVSGSFTGIVGYRELMKQKLLNNSNNEKTKTIDEKNKSEGM